MLLAVGVDIVSVKRFEELHRKYGERLIKKVFPEGVDYCFKKRKGELQGCLAARFALKEATVKALSQAGLRTSISRVKVLGGGKELKVEVEGLKGRGLKLLFSISHERDYAVAVVNLVEETRHYPV
ncbi:MAG: 4'-phosphopantetheinyl transferase superfamily protein [Desulfurobacteriaceae bacterium]